MVYPDSFKNRIRSYFGNNPDVIRRIESGDNLFGLLENEQYTNYKASQVLIERYKSSTSESEKDIINSKIEDVLRRMQEISEIATEFLHFQYPDLDGANKSYEQQQLNPAPRGR